MRMLKDKDNPNGGCEDRFCVLPGDDVKLTFPTAGMPPKAVSDTFTIVDFYESKMSEIRFELRLRADPQAAASCAA